MCSENIQRNDALEIGYSTMPILLLTLGLSVQKFLVRNSTIIVPHPPNFPDLALCDFSPPQKLILMGREIITSSQT
jgi:hypothetical protein